MADIKISQLGAAIAVGDTDLLPIVSGGNTLKATAAQVKEHSIGNTNISSMGDGSVTGAISALNTDKQPKTLATPLTIGGVSKTTVEDALGGLVSENQTLTQDLANEAVTRSKVGAHNLCKLSLAEMKSLNDSGTWTGNEYTHPTSGVKCTVNTDSNGNVTSIKVNGTSAVSSATTFLLTTSVDFGTVSTRANSYDNVSFNGYIITDGSNDNPDCYVFYNSSKQVGIRIGGNATLSNVMVYPMIRLASDPNTEFEPYAMTNAELTEHVNGLVVEAITSNSITIAAGSNATVYVPITKSNYTPLGIMGITSFSSEISPYEWSIASTKTQAYAGIKNRGSISLTGALTFNVLYKKS